ncbi:VOC family protein [Bdellovibrio sp. SKB1291214]|uniref:VOC family protein n=1 Tax=Bdellovibrio sp. SKB1291214 TaxID=1732569 RepID=UPI001C3DFEED|nr:VOC family protein [Bdellovibrio sp. SKB1291214]UYL10293.1 VOC family protein [Bdellovibrio sp. SKB1291214]
MEMVPNLMLFYVKDPIASQKFYENIFMQKPAAAFPTYVAFQFPNGLTFSLWSTQAKDFVSDGSGHRSELAFMVSDEDQVRALHDKWKTQGIKIEQDLKKAVFGLTFVALDPDGHRIRVCIPDKN